MGDHSLSFNRLLSDQQIGMRVGSNPSYPFRLNVSRHPLPLLVKSLATHRSPGVGIYGTGGIIRPWATFSILLKCPETWLDAMRESAMIECLDHFVVLGEKHLQHIISEYVRLYNEARPHEGGDHLPPALKVTRRRFAWRHRLL
jgi:hypothetical protein